MYKHFNIILFLIFIGLVTVYGAVSFASRVHKHAKNCYVFESFMKPGEKKGTMKKLPVGQTQYFTDLCGKCKCLKTKRADVLLLECKTCPRRLETMGCTEKLINFKKVKYPDCCKAEDDCKPKAVVLK